MKTVEACVLSPRGDKEAADLLQLQCTDCKLRTVFLEDCVVCVNICQIHIFGCATFPDLGKVFSWLCIPEKSSNSH